MSDGSDQPWYGSVPGGRNRRPVDTGGGREWRLRPRRSAWAVDCAILVGRHAPAGSDDVAVPTRPVRYDIA